MTYMATVRSRDTVLPYGLLFGAFEKQGGTCTSKRRSRCVDARGKDCTHYVHTILMLLDAAEKHEQARASVTNGNSDAYPRCRDAISANWPPQIPQPQVSSGTACACSLLYVPAACWQRQVV